MFRKNLKVKSVGIEMITIVGALLCSLICLQAPFIGEKLSVLDMPGGRKDHLNQTPLVGGVAIFLPFIGALVAYAIFIETFNLSSFFLSTLVVVLIGYTDDRLQLEPKLRLILVAVVCLLLFYQLPSFMVKSIGFSWGGSAIQLGYFSLFFTLLALVGFVNVVNMADGRNGLVIGLSLIWMFFFYLYGKDFLPMFIWLIVPPMIITLFFNLRSKLFLGDAGSYGLGFFIGALSIYVYNLDIPNFKADTIALLFLIPLLDSFRVAARRMKRGLSPFQGDRDHLHHYLSDLFSWRIGWILYISMVFSLNFIAYLYPELIPVMIFASVAIYSAIIRYSYLKLNKIINN